MTEYSIHLIDDSKIVVEADGYGIRERGLLTFFLKRTGGGRDIVKYRIPTVSILYIQTSYVEWRDEIQRRRDNAQS